MKGAVHFICGCAHMRCQVGQVPGLLSTEPRP